MELSPLFLTIVLAIVVLLLAFALLGLGWIVRGKSSIRPGGCGYDPTKSQDENCGEKQSCILCKNEKADDDLPEE